MEEGGEKEGEGKTEGEEGRKSEGEWRWVGEASSVREGLAGIHIIE